jgi:glycine betaine/proline transport system ATP-binding protein
VQVLTANALLRPLSELRMAEHEYCLSQRHDYWLKLGKTPLSSVVRYGSKNLDLQNWSLEIPVETLLRQPTLVQSNTLMKEVMKIRYHTGHGVLVVDQNKIIGYIGDKSIYHAMLGKLFEED